MIVLHVLAVANVATDPGQAALVHNGGPAEVQAAVARLGTLTHGKIVDKETLSTGVEVLAKPSDLAVPPWQMVSAELGGLPLVAATLWESPEIPTTTASTTIGCWDPALAKPGPVTIAMTGSWNGQTFNLTGGGGKNFNHAKLGVSPDASDPHAIFGDMNQQGSLDGNCSRSQNGRGGTFFILDNLTLANGLRSLIGAGTSAAGQSTRRPPARKRVASNGARAVGLHR